MADKQKTFFLGVVIEMASMPLNMLLSFIVVPIYLQYITTAEYGYWSTTLEMVGLGGLLLVSFDLWMVRGISGSQGRGDRIKLILLEGASCIALLTLLAGLALTGVWLLRPDLLERFQINREPILILAMIAWAILMTINQYFNSILMGQNRMPLSNSLVNLTKFGYMLIPVAFLWAGWQLSSFGFGYVIMTLVILVIQLALLTPQVLKWSAYPLPSALRLKETLNFALQNFLSKVGAHFYNYANILLIAHFYSSVQVAIYLLSLKLTNFTRFIVPRVINVGYPSYARLIAEGEKDRMTEVLLKLFRISLRLGLLFSAVIILLNEIFVVHWVGEHHYAGGWFSLLAGLICLKESVFPIFFQSFFASDQVQKTHRIFLAEWTLHLGLAIWLIPQYGITGALGAALFSTSLLSLFYFAFSITRMLEFSPLQLVKNGGIILLKSLPTLGVLALTRWQQAQSFNWFYFFLWLALAGLVNLISFEGNHWRELKGLKPKEMIQMIIDRT